MNIVFELSSLGGDVIRISKGRLYEHQLCSAGLQVLALGAGERGFCSQPEVTLPWPCSLSPAGAPSSLQA